MLGAMSSESRGTVGGGPRLRPALDGVPAYRAGRPAPEGAFKISSNENPYPPLPSVIEALRAAAADINRYPDFASAELVAALADRFALPVDQIAVGTGSVGVAQQIVQSTAGPGDEVRLRVAVLRGLPDHHAGLGRDRGSGAARRRRAPRPRRDGSPR